MLPEDEHASLGKVIRELYREANAERRARCTAIPKRPGELSCTVRLGRRDDDEYGWELLLKFRVAGRDQAIVALDCALAG